MCFLVYLAADKPLRMIEWNEAQPGFHVSDLAETEQNVRCQFSKKDVVYVGAHEGCGCGFQYGEYGPENYGPEEWSQCLRSLEQFSEYLRGEIRRVGTIQLFACWSGDQVSEPEHHRTLTPAFLTVPGFFFLQKELSTIVEGAAG